MNEKVLIVEDEENIRKFIVTNLEISNFEVKEAGSSEEAMKICNSYTPDVIVLDIMLPGLDGYRLCKILREKFSNVVIVMLTAKAQDSDKIHGLDIGADDYMIKPFNPMELISRINAILRRVKRNDKSLNEISRIEHGNLKLKLKEQKLYKDNKEIEITNQEYSLIKFLMQNPNTAFNRDELLDKAWGESFFGDYKTVDVHVRRLRIKIEDDPSKPVYIQTVWGYGYRFSSS
ncbi:alkaline phosphatase synthesis transcriptional regulatory protein SphR [Clostridium puniceum]|uniref:Stage 0 sporulation protein A homolog n=1 Tax=Clostridium puniceum TaxID=29367 RepID=A0A1S8TX94_9CLOT|nr:response regulator transcription factor [Clostridium puniceum]OOM82357.1 alkaline phosphatase synthesis transcriptional regulatory protein SphR [Clostridium puniceum]